MSGSAGYHVIVCMLAVALTAAGCGWKLETREAPAAAPTGESENARALAPKFSLPNDDGTFVSLDDLLANGRPAVLVFYRGRW